MHINAFAAAKDIERRSGHPALACDSPLEQPSIKPPLPRYYQQHPPNDTAITPTSTASEDSEFDFRRSDPAHVKVEPTIIDKVKEVLYLPRQLSRRRASSE